MGVFGGDKDHRKEDIVLKRQMLHQIVARIGAFFEVPEERVQEVEKAAASFLSQVSEEELRLLDRWTESATGVRLVVKLMDVAGPLSKKLESESVECPKCGGHMASFSPAGKGSGACDACNYYVE
jgi:tRNA(Ile2) C34 agmatinyltransferase TiaS